MTGWRVNGQDGDRPEKIASYLRPFVILPSVQCLLLFSSLSAFHSGSGSIPPLAIRHSLLFWFLGLHMIIEHAKEEPTIDLILSKRASHPFHSYSVILASLLTPTLAIKKNRSIS